MTDEADQYPRRDGRHGRLSRETANFGAGASGFSTDLNSALQIKASSARLLLTVQR
jgi:hypothetical protein